MKKKIHKGSRKQDQAVRTTFMLSEDALEELELLKSYHGVTIREVFDTLSNILKKMKVLDSQLKSKIENFLLRDRPVKKSVALDPQSLQTFKLLSKRYQIPRDVLVEFAMESYRVERRMEKEFKMKKYEAASKIMAKFNINAEETQNQLNKLIEYDGPLPEAIPDIFELIVILSKDLEEAINIELSGGPEVDVPVDVPESIYGLKGFRDRRLELFKSGSED
jgi:hypothetical protein